MTTQLSKVILVLTLIALSRNMLASDIVLVDDHVCLKPYPHPHESDHLTCVYSAYYFNKHTLKCEDAIMSCKVFPRARVHLVNAFWVRAHCEGYCRPYMVEENKEQH